MPVLTVIAGPNGAGKSTHSKELLSDFGIDCFDFNKEFHTIWSEFNFEPYIAQSAYERAQKAYLDRRTSALNKGHNFSLETNFDSPDILSVVEMFRSKRHHIELIFICLEGSSLAVERVKDRVAKGGHAVDEETIIKRFDAGLAMLDENFGKFDLVSVYLSKPNDVEGVALLEPLRSKAISVSRLPLPLASRLPKLTQFMETRK